MLRPLPHRDGDRLMFLRQSASGPGRENVAFSVPEITDFRSSSKTLGGIAEYSPITFTMVGESDAERIDVGLVTGNYLSVMGLSPVLGRAFNGGDDGRGAAPVMMLTHDYWQKRFAGDSAIVGKTLRVGGKGRHRGRRAPARAVLPGANRRAHEHGEQRAPPERDDGHRPHAPHDADDRAARARRDRRSGPRSKLPSITKRAHADHPEAYDAASGYQTTLTPFKEVLGQKAQLTLWLLMGAAAFVLIIACANVANLTLMRGVRREHELVVRAALGAGTARLRRLLLVENLVLALAGAVLGLAIAFGGVRMLMTFAARYSPRANEIRIDGAVLGFAIALAVLVAIILSFAPKLAGESTLGPALAAGGRRTTGGARRQRLQQTLVVAQVAVSVVLLTGAGLLTRTMQRLALVDTGMNGSNVVTMEVPSDFSSQDNVAAISRYERMQSQLAALPGVTQVGLGSTVPLRRRASCSRSRPRIGR